MTYRNFIRSPFGHEVFGSNRSAGGCLRSEAYKLDMRLALPYSAPGDAMFNPAIPSGYTYFAQFVAHDCVLSSPSTPVAACLGMSIENKRRAALHLDTLYGGGPEEFPVAYFAHRAGSTVRTKFKLSRPTVADDQAPFRDVGRARPVRSNDTAECPGDAMVADARNDVHATISQITALFQVFHNTVVDQLEEMHDCCWSPLQDVVSHALFQTAKHITTAVFRNIVRDDLLPRLLHPAIYDHYFNKIPEYLDPNDLARLPVEFAKAYRFGHAMVRPFYIVNIANPHGEQLQDMMLTTSLHRPWRMPLDETWLIQWSQFFELGSTPTNSSRRIVPQMSEGLVSATLFSPFDESRATGLVYRDLINNLLQTSWSIPALIAEIIALQPRLASLFDQPGCASALSAWLKNYQSATNLDDDTIDQIVNDPPLMIYVLIEAAHTMGGTRLGTLGSILLAEVLRKALDTEIAGSRDMLDKIAPRIDDRFLPEAVGTMPALIEFVAKYAMPETVPPFV